MEANNRDQNKPQTGTGNQEESIGQRQVSQDNSRKQIGRLESQPGNMSGVTIEDQRTRSENQDLGSRGTDHESSESL